MATSAPWRRRNRRQAPPGRYRAAAQFIAAALCLCAWLIATAARADAAPLGAAQAANISLTPLSPGVLTANGTSQATATVTLSDAQGNPIAGDAAGLQISSDDPLVHGSIADDGNGVYTATVISSTTAHRVTVTVTETSAGISASEPLTFVHGSASRVSVALNATVLVANGISSTMATVVVSDAHGNRITGDAVTLSSRNGSVRFGPVTDVGNGVYRARVYSPNTPGATTIRATDISASPTTSGTTTLTGTPAPSLVSLVTMQWTFAYSFSYTTVPGLVVSGAPTRAWIDLGCSGTGCPFSKMTLAVARQPRCSARPGHLCRSGSNLFLTAGLAHHHLAPGARLTVAVVRPGWIGKFYSFRVRAGTGPAISISCLAPQGSRPGVGC